MKNDRPPEDPCSRMLDELSRRDWTQQMLATVIGRPPQTVSEIITGKKRITEATAIQLGAALDTPAREWMRLQSDYQLWVLERTTEVQSDIVLIKARSKEIRPRYRPLRDQYKVEWDGRRHVATMESYPDLRGESVSSPEYALRKLRKLVAEAKAQEEA